MIRPYWKPFLPVLLAAALLGLVASLIVHVLSLTGVLPPTGEYTWGLHIGIFVVWFPAVILMQQLMPDKKNFNQKDVWKVALRGCPPWVEKAIMGLFYYAIVNFVVFFFFAVKSPPASRETPDLFRGFSGHWMIFYGVAAAVFYSAMHATDEGRRCPNGHAVSLTAKSCEDCGLPVSDR